MPFHVTRFAGSPLIHPDSPGFRGDEGENINGPTLIRVPAWLANPLGAYYLYFAHHGGGHIRLAYADRPTGPFTIKPGGVFSVEQIPSRIRPVDHVASPEILIDSKRRQIRMYYHACPRRCTGPYPQPSFVATSSDGLAFESGSEIVGPPYMRVFRRRGKYFALGKNANIGGMLLVSEDGLQPFSLIGEIIPRQRHVGLYRKNDVLYVFMTRMGDCPESILCSRMDISGAPDGWTASEPELVLKPETAWEGATLPVAQSRPGPAHSPECALRDPFVYEEDGELLLFYAVAGERGIAVAHLEIR